MATGVSLNSPWRRSVKNGAAFSTVGFVAKVILTPALSHGERGLSAQALIYFSRQACDQPSYPVRRSRPPAALTFILTASQHCR